MNSFDFSKVHFNTGLLVKECFERDIEVQYMGDPDILLASYQGHDEIITETTLSCMPYPLKYIIDDKYFSKLLLQRIGISTTLGKSFKKFELGKALLYSRNIGYPVVVKPTLWSHGESVHMNLNTFDEIANARDSITWVLWNYVDGDLLVEKQFEGKEFRIFITKNDFIAVVEREPANIIGDGIHTIRELIDQENYRRMHPRNSCLCEIWIDDIAEKFMRDTWITFQDIPKKGKKVYIRPNSNVSGGGNCYDVTDKVHSSVIAIAREILQKLALPYVGIDFMTKDISKKQTKKSYIICELNTMPGLSLHTHEETGRAKNVAGALIDLIYPETKENKTPEYPDIQKTNATFSAKYPKSYFYKPLAVEIEITTKCNLKCSECGILSDVKKPHDLPIKDLIQRIKNQKAGIYAYSITGGEPFLKFDELLFLIKELKEYDLFKIQTNGSFFSSKAETLSLLRQLKNIGLWTKNKYLKPTIACSFGMQTMHGVKLDNICHFCYAMKKVRPHQEVIGRLNLTVATKEKESYYLAELEKRYEELYGEKFDYNFVAIQSLLLYHTDTLTSKKKKTPIKEVIERYRDWDCFWDRYERDTPFPKMLIRSTGEVYACVGFEHVCKLGNISTDSLEQIIKHANQDTTLKILKTWGVSWLFTYCTKNNPKMAKESIVESSASCSLCTVCKHLTKNYLPTSNHFL